MILSYNPEYQCIEARRARTVLIGQRRIVRVRTDKGCFFLSADQRVRLSSGGYVAAGDLQPGMSLHAVSLKLSQGYIWVGKADQYFHRLTAASHGHDIREMSVHHRDRNKLNNRGENLEVMTQAEHASLHGKEEVAAGKHVFPKRRFPKRGETNPMHSSSSFWKNSEKSSSYCQKQGDILKSSGRASEMQGEAAKQKRCNYAFKILNSGHSIDTSEAYYKGFKAMFGRAGHSKANIMASINAAFGSYAGFVDEVKQRNHRVVAVEEMGLADVYAVVIDGPRSGDPHEAAGNFLIMSVDATSHVGSGILVAGSEPPGGEVHTPLPTQNPPLVDSCALVIGEAIHC